MAKVKIIKKYSDKKYKDKKATKKQSKAEAKVCKKPTYTYVLKDLVKGIYKIGKTTNPHIRFNSLCLRGRIYPIALVNRDIEAKLHSEYADNRVVHPDYKGNGGTEWFKPGGKFDIFIKTIDTGKIIPYITINTMMKELIEANVIRVNDPSTEWELSQSKYGYYYVGVEILVMLGFLKRSIGKKLFSEEPNKIMLIGNKVSISEEVIEKIKVGYVVFLSINMKGSIVAENRSEKSRLRKIDISSPELDSEVYLLLNLVL